MSWCTSHQEAELLLRMEGISGSSCFSMATSAYPGRSLATCLTLFVFVLVFVFLPCLVWFFYKQVFEYLKEPPAWPPQKVLWILTPPAWPPQKALWILTLATQPDSQLPLRVVSTFFPPNLPLVETPGGTPSRHRKPRRSPRPSNCEDKKELIHRKEGACLQG